MPAKNAGRYLHECIESVRHQSETNWELLIVNDFSNDNTEEIVREFVHTDSRIHLLKNQEPGIIPALNLAFSNSTGTYISRMDADDKMPPEKLSTLLNIASKNHKTVATGRVNYFSDTKISPGYVRYEEWLNEVAANGAFYENMYRECVIASPNWMVHRSCFENDIPFSSLNYPEDYDLVLKWFNRDYEFLAADAVTHLWREHPVRTSRTSDRYQQKSFFNLKTKSFIQNQLKSSQPVQLVGAGQKGKLVAKILRETGVLFRWFEYGIDTDKGEISPVVELIPQFTTILTNWPVNKDLQKDIRSFLDEKNLVPGKNLWLF